MSRNAKIDGTAEVHPTAKIGENVQVWNNSQIRELSIIGDNSIIGSQAYIDAEVLIGKNCKIQNGALIYKPAVVEDGVFIGPGVILTNDHNPRAINPDFNLKKATDWTEVGVQIGRGASIGAGSICVAPLKIGSWAMIAAGSVVTRDVPDFALFAGVPAKQIGWVGRSGFRLTRDSLDSTQFVCPVSGSKFIEDGGVLNEI